MVVYKQDVDNGPSGFVWVVTCLGFGELKFFVLFSLKKTWENWRVLMYREKYD